MRSWTRLLPALALLSALASPSAGDVVTTTTTSTVPLCPGGDADCDDGNACTLDTCAGPDGCRHDPVGVDAVRSAIDRVLAADVCPGESLPPVVPALGQRARTLIDRAAAETNPARSARLVRTAIQRLKRSARRVAAAGAHDRVSGGCAGGLGAALGTATARAACLLPETVSGAPFACLSGRGPLVTLRGTRSTEYSNRSLAPGTRIDARAATFLASSSSHYPISLDGGADICLAGGTVRGEYDRSLDWATMHDMNNAGAAFASPTTVDGIRVDDVTDGLRPRGIGPFTVRNAWLSYIRDDCVENDHVEGGVIEDSLFDGCYVGISERPSDSIGGDGRRQLLTIRRSLLRLEPMPGPRNGVRSELGNGEFFKWSDVATGLALYDNVFMAEKTSQDGPDKMGIPANLTGCARNVMVWLGPGSYPAPLPACFQVTRDRAVWDAAVADWKRRHPDVGR